MPALRGGLSALRRVSSFVPRGRARVVCLILAGLLLVGGATQLVYTWFTRLPEDAVLRAGDTVVTEQALGHRVRVLEALYGIQAPEGARDKFNRDAAKSLAVSLILDRAASERKIVISDKQAQDALSKIIQQLPGGRPGFLELLSSRGISEPEVVDEIKRQLATSRLFEEVTSGVRPVSDHDVRQAYSARADRMVAPEKRHLLNIVVDSRDRAAEVLRQAESGSRFTTLAARYSLDGSTKENGGDLGSVTAVQLDRAYADAAFAAAKGSFFGPVRTEHGWNIGQVREIEPATPLSFAEVRVQLEQELNSERRLKAWRDWLAAQIAAVDAEYADKYRPENPDAPPADAPVGLR